MRLDIDGRPVHYVDFGGPQDAPRAVYVHGLGGSHLNWTAVAPLLGTQLRAIAVDMPGFGRTPAAGRRTTISANALVLRQFLQRLGWGPVILIGNSMGGYLSMRAAVDQPALARAVVLVDPTLPLVGRIDVDPAVRRIFFLHGIPGVGEFVLARRNARVPARQRMSEVLGRCCADAGRIPTEMVEEMIALEEELTLYGDHASAHLSAARSIVRSLARRSAYWRRLAAIRQPVLLLHGIHDRLIPIASARAAAQRNPHWTYVELDAGHVPHMETAQQVATEILRWLPRTMQLWSRREGDESGRG